ncbi:MAG: hypothetical protein WC648_04595 [Candidatus Paceibacterota bacterium]|jgi:hypothetical protein
MIALTAGTIDVGTKTTNVASAVDISAEGALIIGQGAGETPAAAALSGDVKMDKTGATTIQAKAVEDTMIAAAAGTILVGTKTDGDVTALDISAEGAMALGQGAGETAAAYAMTGDVAMTKGGVTSIAGTAKTMINGLRTWLADGLLQIGTLLISATAEKFKTTTELIYTIAGLPYTKTATDDLVFSAANTINTAAAAGTNHWGAWIVEIGVDGTFHTKPAAFTTAADMDYTDEASAIAALPAVTASHVQVGYITVQSLDTTDWVANTDNLTEGLAAGNCTSGNFYDLPGAKSLPAALA